MVEVRVLAAAALALASVQEGDETGSFDLISVATELGVWDPVVCALRASQPLATLFASQTHLRPLLQELYDPARLSAAAVGGDADVFKRALEAVNPELVAA